MATTAVDLPIPGRRRGRSSSEFVRKYPPLLSLVVVLFLALAVLPSALNLPQSNPTQTLEYAPVPPDDTNNNPPPNGNLSSLGLAGSSSLESGGLPGGDDGLLGTPKDPKGAGKSPQTKHCVGNPPKQTEDPLAPPCVADFRGDNFGATYQGVTKDEVIVLFYIQGFTDYTNGCREATQITPDRQYFDLGSGQYANYVSGEHCMITMLRDYQAYFNSRYQTYGRFVHFWVYFSERGNSAEERRADAADNYAKLHPFAVISTGSSFNDDYLDTMATRGVLNFGSFLARDNAFFQQFPKLVWGFPPSLEETGRIFAGYLCKKVANKRVDATNNPTDVGKERVYGMWHTNDPHHQELIKLAAQIKSVIEKCGIKIKVDATFPEAGYTKSAHYPPTKAQQAVADFRNAEVTTVIWPGGMESNFTNQADANNYRPEFFALGDGDMEGFFNGSFQAPNVWDKARMITTETYVKDIRQEPCYLAEYEANPDAYDTTVRGYGCQMYPLIRQLFTGIQVAGPRLGPSSIDKGFRAIPHIASTSPGTPACFYEPGDYTCVKDAEAMHWDKTGRATQSQQGNGCYRATQGGKRYFGNIWPDGNSTAQDNERGVQDPCNTFDSGILVNPAPPDKGSVGP